jgi:hypothetical protein
VRCGRQIAGNGSTGGPSPAHRRKSMPRSILASS